MYRIGVVGDKDSILFFKAIGMEVFPVIETEVEENRKLIDHLAQENFGIIFITEQVAKPLTETLDRYNNKPTPGIILIPSNQGSLGIGAQRVRDNVERAVGMNILDT